MSLTPIDDIRDRILSGRDNSYAESLYRQELALLGCANRGYTKSKQGEIPYFPKLTIRELEVGKSRPMLESIHILTSRLLSSQIGVKITGAHRVTADVMQQYFRIRLEEGSWLGDIRAAGRDTLVLGIGVLVVGLEDDDKSGMQRVSVRHHAPWYTIVDPYADNIERAEWVALLHHLSPEAAVELGFKAHDVETHSFTILNDSDGSVGQVSRPVVRVYEYYDCNTRCLMLDNLDAGIVKRTENPFGCIPIVFGTNYNSPVLSKPYGRVFTEGAAQAFVNELEAAWKNQMQTNKRMRVIEADRLDAEDLRAWHDGESDLVRVIDVLDRNPVRDIPSQPVDRNLLEALQYATSKLRSASNLTDLDRGQMASRRVSATEVDTLQSITNANRTSEVSAITSFVRKLAEKVFEIGKLWDTAPIMVNIMGSEVLLNDLSQPNSRLSLVFDESEYRVLVDAESLTASDDRQKRAMKIAELRELAPLVGQSVPLELFTKRLLEAMGEDPAEWSVGQQQMIEQVQQQSGQQIPQQGGQPRVEDIARGETRSLIGAEQR